MVIVVTGCGATEAPAAPMSAEPVTGSGTAVSPELDQLLEDYIAAFNDYDVEAFQALVTEGYMAYRTEFDSHYAVSSGIAETSPIEWVIAGLKGFYPNLKFYAERRGQAIMSGDGPWLVSQVIFEKYNDPKYPNGIEGISTLTVVDEDGMLKVARDIFVALEVE